MNEVGSLTNVTKTFKHKTAVKDVTFSIGKGEIVAILVPNGAGKTTTISMILGLIYPIAGEIRIFNQLPQEKQVHAKMSTMRWRKLASCPA